MAKGIVRTRNSSRLPSTIIVVVGLIALFLIGFQISNFIFQPATASVAETASSGAVALVSPPQRLSNFALTSKTGDPIQLSDLRGRVVALFFGYTHCPEECPTTLADYKRAKEMLGDQADQVEFVFVSVDGQRDTPQQMTAYLDHFDPDFIGMTGSETQLRRLGTEYGLVFNQETIGQPALSDDSKGAPHDAGAEAEPTLDSQNYFVQHTSPSFLIDREGNLRMVAFYRTAPDKLAASLRQLLSVD